MQPKDYSPFAEDPFRGWHFSVLPEHISDLNSPVFLKTTLIDYIVRHAMPKDLPDDILLGSSNSIIFLTATLTRRTSRIRRLLQLLKKDWRSPSILTRPQRCCRITAYTGITDIDFLHQFVMQIISLSSAWFLTWMQQMIQSMMSVFSTLGAQVLVVQEINRRNSSQQERIWLLSKNSWHNLWLFPQNTTNFF